MVSTKVGKIEIVKETLSSIYNEEFSMWVIKDGSGTSIGGFNSVREAATYMMENTDED